MKNITIKKIIDFNSKSRRSKHTLVRHLLNPPKSSNSSGGHYWISSISAMTRAFRFQNSNILEEKINELVQKATKENRPRFRKQWLRNSHGLENFIDEQLFSWFPKEQFHIEDSSNKDHPLPIADCHLK